MDGRKTRSWRAIGLLAAAAALGGLGLSCTEESDTAAADPNPPDTLWTRACGTAAHEWGNSILEAADGGFVVAGGVLDGADRDIWLVKVDGDGDPAWDRRLGGPGHDDAYAIRPTADGGFIVAASTESFGNGAGDFWLVKLDGGGATSWSRTYGSDAPERPQYAEQTADGGYVIAGGRGDFTQGLMDAWLVRTDDEGNEIWSRSYGGPRNEKAYCVHQTADGGFVLAGNTESFGNGTAGSADMWLVRTDPAGAPLWTRTFGGPDPENAYSLQLTNDGGYVLAGYTGAYGSGLQDMLLVRTDADGNEVWSNTYGGADDDVACSVQQMSDGGYLAAGLSDSFGGGDFDACFVRTDACGATLWRMTVGGPADDYCFWAQRTADGGCAATGTTASYGHGSDDLYIVRLGPELLPETGRLLGPHGVAW
ncbi:MAG: PQQ-like beta-propeller repeat protein [Candidatus Krumholzibacteriota bacterium]|nr:PQQ-like beta-propeller repeat protein [Candidatus Krumholzibacteriota bacterium]